MHWTPSVIIVSFSRFAAPSPWDVLPSRSGAHRLRFRLLRITCLSKLFYRFFGRLKTFKVCATDIILFQICRQF